MLAYAYTESLQRDSRFLLKGFGVIEGRFRVVVMIT